MKKILTMTLGLVLSALSASAAPYLCIYTIIGGDTPEVIGADGLTLSVENENLMITKEGAARSIALNTLVGMEFSEDTTLGIDAILSSDSSFELYDLGGVKIGEFSSLDQASAALSQNVYVIRSANGKSFKILLGK